MSTLPARADANRIHAQSGTSTPFIHAQRFADGWNACLEFMELSCSPAVENLIKASNQVTGTRPPPLPPAADDTVARAEAMSIRAREMKEKGDEFYARRRFVDAANYYKLAGEYDHLAYRIRLGAFLKSVDQEAG